MESTNAVISATMMPACNLLLNDLLFLAAFLLPGLNVAPGGGDAGAGGGMGGDCGIGITMAGLVAAMCNGIVVAGLCAAPPAMLVRIGGGVIGNGINVTARP